MHGPRETALAIEVVEGAITKAPELLRAAGCFSAELDAKLASIAKSLQSAVPKSTSSDVIEFDVLPEISNSILGSGRLSGSGIRIANAEVGAGFEMKGPLKIVGTENAPIKIGKQFDASGGVEVAGSTVGDRVTVGPQSLLSNALVGNDVTIGARSSVLDKTSIARRTKIEDDVHVDPGVILGQSVKIFDGVHIGPGTRIDAQTKIGVGAKISDSFIGRGAKLDPQSAIHHSTIGDRVRVGTKASVVHSFIPDGDKVAPGARFVHNVVSFW